MMTLSPSFMPRLPTRVPPFMPCLPTRVPPCLSGLMPCDMGVGATYGAAGGNAGVAIGGGERSRLRHWSWGRRRRFLTACGDEHQSRCDHHRFG